VGRARPKDRIDQVARWTADGQPLAGRSVRDGRGRDEPPPAAASRDGDAWDRWTDGSRRSRRWAGDPDDGAAAEGGSARAVRADDRGRARDPGEGDVASSGRGRGRGGGRVGAPGGRPAGADGRPRGG